MDVKTKKFGFGLMRLPQLSAETTDIDHEQLNQMVDLYLEAGFDYFDTSYAYHNGESEVAIRKCLVSRYPRERFRLASKLPTFIITEEAQVEEIFEQQLARCGVDFFDYYLLHNVNGMRYRQVIRDTHMFDYLKKWKEEGKIRYIAFSFHDSADVLDRILTEHPEVEAVQIALNYVDWDAYFVQAKACYDVIRKHGRQVIIMEPVKGGMLIKVPEEAEKLMEAENPGASAAFMIAGTNDWIVPAEHMPARAAKMRKAGIPTECTILPGVEHGFGTGKGMKAEGWIDKAVDFWEQQIK